MGGHAVAALFQQVTEFILRDIGLAHLQHVLDFFQVLPAFPRAARMHQLPGLLAGASLHTEGRARDGRVLPGVSIRRRWSLAGVSFSSLLLAVLALAFPHVNSPPTQTWVAS